MSKQKLDRAAKLSFEQAEHIRALYALTPYTHRELAEQYGVSASAIEQIVRYQCYVPAHMKKVATGPKMCRAGLHNMRAENAKTKDGSCRLCRNANIYARRKEKPKIKRDLKYKRKHKGIIGAPNLSEVRSGPCEICEEFYNELHMDHCHTTNYYRGWLCRQCNLQLGILEKTEWVKKATQYLEEKTAIIKKRMEDDS